MSIGNRIKESRKAKRLSQPELSNLCGWESQTRISNYERDFRTPNLQDLERIADALEVNLNWLATGQGKRERADYTLSADAGHFRISLAEQLKKLGVDFEQLSEEDRALLEEPYEITPEMEDRIRESEAEYSGYFSLSHPIKEHFARIAKYDVELSAGHGASIGDEAQNGFLYFRKDWLERKELDEKNLCVVYVKGHSMEPTICDKEVILVDTSEYYTHRENVDDGFIYAINLDGEAMVKRLFKKPGGGLIVRSDSPSPQYKDMILEGPDLDYLRIIGRAIWHAGDL